MSKSNEFAKYVLLTVAHETEIPCETILSKCRQAEVVDARHIAVMLLYKSGMYVARIADIMKITPRYVQYIITDFEDRMKCNRPLRNKYEIIANKLRNNLEITAL